MILGILRVVYFFGPVLALSLVVLPDRHRYAMPLWILAAVIVLAHWIAFFTATEDGATSVEYATASVWSPLLLTTLLAARTRAQWENWFESDAAARSVVAIICLLPSVIAFFLLI